MSPDSVAYMRYLLLAFLDGAPLRLSEWRVIRPAQIKNSNKVSTPLPPLHPPPTTHRHHDTTHPPAPPITTTTTAAPTST